MTDTAGRIDARPELAPEPYPWLKQARTTLFVLGAVFVLASIGWQIAGWDETPVFPFGFAGALCLVGGVNAMVWRHLLAHRDPGVTRDQRRSRTVLLIALFAVASVAVVAALMLLGLWIFFFIMNASSGL
jgi:hypothetical protein